MKRYLDMETKREVAMDRIVAEWNMLWPDEQAQYGFLFDTFLESRMARNGGPLVELDSLGEVKWWMM